MPIRVPVAELVDPERLRALGPAPSPAALRALLPRGWVPADDGLHARRDLRLFFREGWILVLCLIVFGSIGAMFVLGAVPRGWGGLLRVLALVAIVWLAAGFAGPLITRALRRSPPGTAGLQPGSSVFLSSGRRKNGAGLEPGGPRGE